MTDLTGTDKEARLFKILLDEFDGEDANPTAKTLTHIFSAHKGRPPEYLPVDTVTIDESIFPGVPKGTKTTVGLLIFNIFLIKMLKVVGYINQSVNNKVWGKLETLRADGVKNGDISTELDMEFINRSQYLLGGPLSHIINTSITGAISTLPPKATKMREKLIKDNAEGLANNDPRISTKIENEVVTEALKEIRDMGDEGVSIFDSGVVDPYNNYRTMTVMKGAVKDNTGESPTGYKIVKSNYDTGIDKEDIPLIADSLVTSAYAKGNTVQDSGAKGKQYNAVLQRVRLAEEGSDCGTKTYLEVTVSEKYLLRYIVEGKNLVQLTEDNLAKYNGKKVLIRDPIYCKSPDPTYCNKCVGDAQYRIGNYNIGLTFNIISGSTLNASMKSFHDASVKYYTVTVEDLMRMVK